MPKITDTLLKGGGARNPNKNFKKFMNGGKSFANDKIRQLNVLGNRVSEGNRLSLEGACREEMIALMTCWKTHGFKENTCTKEYDSFFKCNAVAKAKSVQARQFGDTKELGVKTVDGKMSAQQINRLLKMFPQPPYRINLTHAYGHELVKPLVFTGKRDSDTQHSINRNLFATLSKRNKT
ncbi:Coiled-coil-helix-coiled-coil-helix domain-containing protein [Mactra antiquata]